VTWLADLKEAQERLQQNPTNRSRPPSRRAPWERGGSGSPSAASAAEDDSAPPVEERTATPAPPVGDADANDGPMGTRAMASAAPRRDPSQRPGAPGVGRTQRFTARTTEVHRPAVCAVYGCDLDPQAAGVTYTALQRLDLCRADAAAPGVQLMVTDHQHLEVICGCGHCTCARPGSDTPEADFPRVTMSEWRLVRPGMATLIAALSLRHRQSRVRIHACLAGLRLHPSIGTIQQTLHEAAAVVAPTEPARLAAVHKSGLFHADATSWPPHDQALWRWVFISATTPSPSSPGGARSRCPTSWTASAGGG
jgi:transposase